MDSQKYSDIGLDHHSRQNASFAMKIGLLCSDLQKQYCCPFFICNSFSGSSSSATIKGASPARRSFAGSNEQDQHPHSPTHLKRGRVPTEKGKAFWHEHSKHVACVKISLNQTDKSKKKKWMNSIKEQSEISVWLCHSCNFYFLGKELISWKELLQTNTTYSHHKAAEFLN